MNTFQKFRSGLTFSNVTAVVALFVALGGTSYAAVSLSNTSVKSRHIGNGQVKRPDLARSAVDSPKDHGGHVRERQAERNF